MSTRMHIRILYILIAILFIVVFSKPRYIPPTEQQIRDSYGMPPRERPF